MKPGVLFGVWLYRAVRGSSRSIVEEKRISLSLCSKSNCTLNHPSCHTNHHCHLYLCLGICLFICLSNCICIFSLFVFKIKLHIKSSKLPHQSPLPSVSLSWYLSFYLSFKLYLYFLSLCVQNQIAHWIIEPATPLPSLSDHKEDHLMRRYMGGLALHHSPLVGIYNDLTWKINTCNAIAKTDLICK